MGGLAVLLILGLYFVLTVLAVIKTKPLWAKGLVLLAALLIPTADAVYGRYQLKQICAVEAGLKVYRVVEHVEGFMEQLGTDYWVRNGGYKFSEDFPLNGTATRYSKRDGQIIQDNRVAPKSQYRVRSIRIGETKDTYLRSQFVVDTIQGEILATDTQIAFNGGWAERFLAQFSDAGGGAVAWCTNAELDPVIRHRKMVVSTLKH